MESLEGDWGRAGDLNQTRGFTEPAGDESLVMNNDLAVLGFLWWWLCVKDKDLVWGHAVRQVQLLG